MKTVTVEKQDNISIVTLSGSVTNPVGKDLVKDMAEAIKEVKASSKGMVLAGGEKFYSIGLNLPELLQMSRDEMSDFWDELMRVFFEIYSLPMPTGAAIAGHAPAAGTIFALTCDFRYIAEGKKMMGMNEIKIGIPTPYLADLMLRQIVGDRTATEMLYRGEFFMPEQALEIRLVDKVFSQEEVVSSMAARIAEIASYDSDAFQAMKLTRTEDIRVKYQNSVKDHNKRFIDCWFGEETQALLTKAAEKF